MRLLAVLTKADKLNRRDADAALRDAQAVLGEVATEAADVAVTLFSALSRQGLGDVAQVLRGWVPPRSAPAPEALAEAVDGAVVAPAAEPPASRA